MVRALRQRNLLGPGFSAAEAAFPLSRTTSDSALVLASDALIGALLGAFVETVSLPPVFASADETPRDTLLRVRPKLVLLDCDYPGGCTEGFLGPASMTGTPVILFGSRTTGRELEAVAERFHLPHMQLPIPPARFAELVRGALNGGVM